LKLSGSIVLQADSTGCTEFMVVSDNKSTFHPVMDQVRIGAKSLLQSMDRQRAVIVLHRRGAQALKRL
jgi:hypothetical protein